jgi:hypothetical protein
LVNSTVRNRKRNVPATATIAAMIKARWLIDEPHAERGTLHDFVIRREYNLRSPGHISMPGGLQSDESGDLS